MRLRNRRKLAFSTQKSIYDVGHNVNSILAKKKRKRMKSCSPSEGQNAARKTEIVETAMKKGRKNLRRSGTGAGRGVGPREGKKVSKKDKPVNDVKAEEEEDEEDEKTEVSRDEDKNENELSDETSDEPNENDVMGEESQHWVLGLESQREWGSNQVLQLQRDVIRLPRRRIFEVIRFIEMTAPHLVTRTAEKTEFDIEWCSVPVQLQLRDMVDHFQL